MLLMPVLVWVSFFLSCLLIVVVSRHVFKDRLRVGVRVRLRVWVRVKVRVRFRVRVGGWG